MRLDGQSAAKRAAPKLTQPSGKSTFRNDRYAPPAVRSRGDDSIASLCYTDNETADGWFRRGGSPACSCSSVRVGETAAHGVDFLSSGTWCSGSSARGSYWVPSATGTRGSQSAARRFTRPPKSSRTSGINVCSRRSRAEQQQTTGGRLSLRMCGSAR